LATPTTDAEQAARLGGYDTAFLREFYGTFTSEREKEALSVMLRLVAAWAQHDADGVANMFTKDGVLILPGDVLKNGRDEIQAFMTAAYAGPFKGSRVIGKAADVRFASDEVALLRSHGGILAPGQTEIAPAMAVRSTWVVVRTEGEWKLAVYQNSPRGAAATLRW
jgi:uncharacterized protein (TIGR02246 family)